MRRPLIKTSEDPPKPTGGLFLLASASFQSSALTLAGDTKAAAPRKRFEAKELGGGDLFDHQGWI